MQTTSALWKSLWASGAATLESVAVINGTEYTDITPPVINRALMQEGLSVGNAVSATCQFTVRGAGTIPKSAEVVVKKRLTDGTQTSEWIVCGTFYISHRTRDPVTGDLTLECYDALLKANADMPSLVPWTTAAGDPITTAAGEILYMNAHYPRTMASVMQDIAILLGNEIRIDPNTQIETGAEYQIESVQPGTRIVDVLKQIAAANGGNWIMTPDNLLKLVPIISAAGASSATQSVVDVDAVVGALGVSTTGTITGIRYTVDGVKNVVGNENDLVLDVPVGAAVAQDLLTKLGGMTYQAYRLTSAIYDPAAELGDYVRAGANGEINAVLYSETATLGPAFRGNMSAPEAGELSDEYPYLGQNAQTLTLARQYTDATTQALDNSLTQQEIFDRLTDGGQTQGISLEEALTPALGASTPKKICLNVDFVNDGEMAFDHLRGGTLTLGGANNTAGVLQLEDANGDIICTLNLDGVEVAQGNVTSYTANKQERALVSAGRIGLQYYGQDSGSGQYTWLDALSLAIRNGSVALTADYPLFMASDGDVSLRAGPAMASNNVRVSFSYSNGNLVFYVGSTPILTIDANGATATELHAGNGATGTFTANGKTVTVIDGVIVSIA